MAITSALGFDPIWSNFNITGVSAGGAQLFSYDSLNPTIEKPIYSDLGLNFPYPNPILFDLNGNGPGPFYFALDSLDPTSLYDLFLYDAQDNLIWNVNSYFPSGGSGGSSNTAIGLKNLVTNSVLRWNVGGLDNPAVPIVLSPTTNRTFLAPGAHDGLSANIDASPASQTENFFGPDIYFIRNNNTPTETITFANFPLGSTTFAPDSTPVQYVNHKNTSLGSSIAYKYYQFPINAKVQNLNNQTVTVTIWAQSVGASKQMEFQWAQFYGDGVGATATDITQFAVANLTTSWAPYTFTVVVPSVAGKNLGNCGNDGLFLLVGMPLDSTFEINFAKPSVYLGNKAPTADFINYDDIDAAVNSPRTGDTRTSLNNYQAGYVPMNDGTIGSAGSTATTRKSIDTFPLFNLIWNSVNNAWAPVTGGRGGTAVADFSVNKVITLTKSLGRVFAGTLNTEILQTIDFSIGTGIPPPTSVFKLGSNTGFGPDVPVVMTAGTTLPAGIIASQTYPKTSITYYANLVGLSLTNITLSLTPGGSFVTATTAGTGTIQVQVTPYQLGQYLGEELHTLNPSELAAHTHDPVAGSTGYLMGVAGGPLNTSGSGNFQIIGVTGKPTSSGGLSLGHNTIQPTTYMNVFIKL